MAVAYETIRRHECQMQGVFCFCFAAEGLHFVPQGGFACRGNLVFSGGKLHLAKVCHAIAAPDHEIYLSAAFAVGSSFNPGGLLGRHACYSKRGFNLPRMLEAYSFEGETLPDDAVLILPHVGPVFFILPCIVAYELKIEQRVVVDQLED